RSRGPAYDGIIRPNSRGDCMKALESIRLPAALPAMSLPSPHASPAAAPPPAPRLSCGGPRTEGQVSELPQRDAGDLPAVERELGLRTAHRRDPDARRRETAHGDPRPEGRAQRRNPVDANPLRRRRAHDACPELAS